MPSLGCLADLEAKGGSGASAISHAVGDVAQLDFKSRHPWRGRKAPVPDTRTCMSPTATVSTSAMALSPSSSSRG